MMLSCTMIPVALLVLAGGVAAWIDRKQGTRP
jgi:hypothetical protein